MQFLIQFTQVIYGSQASRNRSMAKQRYDYNGDITYTYWGTGEAIDTFEYTIQDERGGTAVAMVNINIDFIENKALPTVGVAGDFYAIEGTDNKIEFYFVRSGNLTDEVTVTFAVSASYEAAYFDTSPEGFSSGSDNTAVIAAGTSKSATYTFISKADSITESKTFRVTVRENANYNRAKNLVLDKEQKTEGDSFNVHYYADILVLNGITLFAKNNSVKALGDTNDDNGSYQVAQNNPGIHQNDIIQGSLNNCYFHAALTSLAKSDWEKIKSIVGMEADDGNSTTEPTFWVKLWNRKTETEVTITGIKILNRGFDMAKLSADTNGLGDSEVWGQVLEAGFAKLLELENPDKGDGFLQMESSTGGSTADAWFALTGVRGEAENQNWLSTDQSIWNRIKRID